MKTKIRTLLNILLISVLIFGISTSCSKNDDPDLATEIAGNYKGTVKVTNTGVTASAETNLVKADNTKLNLTLTISGQPAMTIPNVVVKSYSQTTYSLSYSDSESSLTATIVNDILKWTMIEGSHEYIFTGSKE